MGMPVITTGDETKEQAVTDLIESIAMQETALSHIINARRKNVSPHRYGWRYGGTIVHA